MKMLSVVGVAAMVLGITESALAEEQFAPARYLATAPHKALELTLAVGYSQAFGDIAKQQSASLTQMGQEGAGLQIGVGYRLEPRLMLGVYGEGAGYSPGSLTDRDAHVSSAAAGVQAQWHFAPYAQLDPWIGAGLGWRGYWVKEDGVGTKTLLGADALRVQAGVDYRATPSLSVSPVLSLSATKFFAENAEDEHEYHEIDSPRSNVFVFAGVMGRFDIGPQRKAGGASVASR
jgi:hypothetical protein